MKHKELLNKRPLVESFLDQGPRPLSSFSFVSIFAWCDFFDFEFKMIDDRLCIFAHKDTGSFLYLPPLGKDFDPATIERSFEYMARGGKIRPVNRVENIPENLLSALGQGRYNQYIKPAEYVYRQADLAALRGNDYKSQRHDCNYFLSRHAKHSFGPYTDADLDACKGLYEQWAQERAKANSDDVYRSMLEENRQVHARLLEYWKPLGLIVRVLKVEGRVIGYTLGFVLDENTFCVYAEIADLSVTGSAAYMFKSFCADREVKDFGRINTMDDFAMPNVAKAKKAYHPSEMIISYTLSLKTG